MPLTKMGSRYTEVKAFLGDAEGGTEAVFQNLDVHFLALYYFTSTAFK